MIDTIQNEAQYQAALERLDALMDAKLDTPEGAELDRLTTLIEAYERDSF